MAKLEEFMNACITGNIGDVESFSIQENMEKFPYIFIRGLQDAASTGQLEVVKYLVLIGIDFQSNGEYAIRNACENGHLEVVKYLVSIGSNIHTDNKDALIGACVTGQFEIVKYILSLGNINLSKCPSLSFYLIHNGHLDIMKYLLELGYKIPENQIVRTDYLSIYIYLFNYLSEECIEKIHKKNPEFGVFYMFLTHFMNNTEWVLYKENIKNNELWDGNIGMIVASYCW